MRIYWLLIIILLFPAPVHATETDASYYGRLMKSCEYKERTTWRDYLLYSPNKRIDECCATSVRNMEKMGARLADNRKCPKDTQFNMLRCTTSKQWCEPAP